MSKRFGRNQRRRAREAIAALEAKAANLEEAYRRETGLMRDISRRLQDANDHARAVAEIVGSNAIAAGEPITLQYQCMKNARDFRLAVPPMRAEYSLMTTQSASMEFIMDETMHLLQCDAVASLTSHEMHCYVQLANGSIGYAISGAALMQRDNRELIELIVPKIARGLVEAIKKARGK